MMPDTYIELSAVPDPAAHNHLEPFLSRYEGLHILALRDAEIESSRRRIERDRFEVTLMQSAQRSIRYGSRHGEARFRWFMLEQAAAPEGLVCVVDNQTPELVYQREVLEHENGANALRGVIICADSPEATLQRFARICGAPDSAITQDEPQTLQLTNASLTVMTPTSLAALYPGFDVPATPSLVGMEIHVARLDTLIAYLQAEQMKFIRKNKSTIAAQLSAPANGILLFSENN